MFVLYVSAGACDKPQHAIQSQYVKKKKIRSTLWNFKISLIVVLNVSHVSISVCIWPLKAHLGGIVLSPQELSPKRPPAKWMCQ